MIRFNYKYRLISIFWIFLIAFGFPEKSEAQDSIPGLIILEGRVLTNDSLLPVPNVHIISKDNHWGSISNSEGSFKIYVSKDDSVLFTAVGFGSKVLYVNDSVRELISPEFQVLMQTDTVMINEILIRAFYDYETFKQIVTSMEPLSLEQFYPEWEGTELLYQSAVPTGFKGPVQMLYDMLNKEARLQRQLIKNRREYNDLMRKLNRHMDTIPPIPEHMQVLPR